MCASVRATFDNQATSARKTNQDLFQTLFEEASVRDEQLKKMKEQHMQSMAAHQKSKSFSKANQPTESRNDFFNRLHTEKLASQNTE